MTDKPATPRLNLVLCWHMHQPWYRESQEGDYRLPWVYLHALKDYVDMVAHLEAHPEMRCVVNFTPVLLEQLADYTSQFRRHLETGERFADPLLNLLAGVDPIPTDAKARAEIVIACRRAHAPLMIDVHPRFANLLDKAIAADDETTDQGFLAYLTEQFFVDLITWYHLAWLGHSLTHLPLVKELLQHDEPFQDETRRALLEIMRDTFDGLIERYAKLANSGQIELSMTPYGHPIVPLLLDIESMHGAQPEAAGPTETEYPGGLERARWHMQEGLQVFEHYLHCRPTGVWLSEGGVSDAALRLLDEFGIRWTASGEGVWQNSLSKSGLESHGEEGRRSLFRPHSVDDCNTVTFFRDDGLSDLIGFEYQQWNAQDAAADFTRHLENIARHLGDDCSEHVVSVILDGENAWEYYPNNAFHFLGALYEALANSELIQPTTFNEAMAACPSQPLKELCPGSWVYGSFSTWIGDPDKNRAWDLLIEAKQVFDRTLSQKQLDAEQSSRLERQLAICEGSDWFWWFGDHNPADSVNDFDRLYRQQLKHLYGMLGEPAPASLDAPISRGGGAAENSGTMRRGNG